MKNPNNCATCDYSKYEHEGGHCYMFRNAPEVVCMQHTRRKVAVVGAGLGGIGLAVATILAQQSADEAGVPGTATPERCESRGGGQGRRTFRCGLPAGHDGDHSALIPTGAPWFHDASGVDLPVGGQR